MIIIMFIFDTLFNTNAYKFDNLVIYIEQKFGDDYDEIHKMLANIDINMCDKNGKNLLHKFPYKSLVLHRILLEHGIDINKKDNLGKTPIFYAQTNEFSFFINHGADLSIRDNSGHSALYYNSRYYMTSCVLPLINGIKIQGVNVNDYSEYSPDELFHKAVLFRDITKMKEMLSLDSTIVNHGIPYTWLNTNELLTPLYIACHNNLYEEFELLIEHGADIKEPTLLIRIIYMCNKVTPDFIKIVQRLVDLGANLHDKNDSFGNCYDDSVLHNCYKSAELMEMFLKTGLDVHCRTTNRVYEVIRNETMILNDSEPLQYITLFTNDISIYKLLFEYGADPNIQNSHGMNAFMSICSSYILSLTSDENRRALIQLFLDNGANIYLKNKYGKTVFDIICQNNQFNDKTKAKIIKLIHEKKKLFILQPKTNEYIYNLLN